MKRFVIFCIVIFLSPTYAQFIDHYGIKVGGTLSYQDWSPIMTGGGVKEKIIGVNFGAFAEFFNGDFLSIVTEINYIQKGFIEKSYLPPSSWEMQIDYLNISLLAKSKINLGVIKPYLLLGPRIDYEINRTNNRPNGTDYDFEKNLFGLKGGIGSELEIFQFNFLCEFLYDYGFGNLDKRKHYEVMVSSYDFRVGIVL